MSAYREMMKGKHSGELGKIEYAIWLCAVGGAVREAAAKELAQMQADLEEYKKLSSVVMCAYCGHESPKSDKMAVIEHTMNCEKRPEVKLLEKAFEIEDRLYQRIIHLTEHAYTPESCDVCKEISEMLRIYHETDEKENISHGVSPIPRRSQ